MPDLRLHTDKDGSSAVGIISPLRALQPTAEPTAQGLLISQVVLLKNLVCLLFQHPQSRAAHGDWRLLDWLHIIPA
jgi:hypothetical protein